VTQPTGRGEEEGVTGVAQRPQRHPPSTHAAHGQGSAGGSHGSQTATQATHTHPHPTQPTGRRESRSHTGVTQPPSPTTPTTQPPKPTTHAAHGQGGAVGGGGGQRTCGAGRPGAAAARWVGVLPCAARREPRQQCVCCECASVGRCGPNDTPTPQANHGGGGAGGHGFGSTRGMKREARRAARSPRSFPHPQHRVASTHHATPHHTRS
jgi:hypothetical protein